jgi:hypothetical protein
VTRHHPRRRTIALFTALAPLLAGVLSAAPAQAATSSTTSDTAAHRPEQQLWSARAATAYAALQQNLYLGNAGHDLYLEQTPVQTGDNAYSYLWEFREATQATLDLQNIPGNTSTYGGDTASRFAALTQYSAQAPALPGFESYVTAPLGSGGDLYYDDNAVVGLSFITRYRADGDQAALRGATAAFTTDTRGWNTDATLPCQGGMDWYESSANNIRAANVTGLFAQLSADLYQITRQSSYLTWAEQAYQWNRSCLMQSPGLYSNDIDNTGTVDPTLWSYNSGAMIGTATELYRATGNATYLNDAVSDANGAMAYWTADGRLYQQPAIFNSYLFQDLLSLDSVRPNAAYYSTLETYAGQLWNDNRNTANNLFSFQSGNGGAPDTSLPVQTLNQSAVVQLFSLLAWNPQDYDRLT